MATRGGSIKSTSINGVKLYSVSGQRSLPTWLPPKKHRALRKNKDYLQRVDIIQDLRFETAASKIKVTPDGEYVIASGIYPPQIKVFELRQLSLKFERHLVSEIINFQAGQTVHVGGLMRLDLTQSSVETIYVTVWASPNVSLHMGKTENVDEIRKKHFGIRLQPPIGQDRVSELGEWKQREIKVSGISWEINCVDIAASGLGWFSLGLKGNATVILWTFDGVEVTQREPLVLDRAPFLERPGFLLPKAISDAIGNQSRIEAQTRKLKEES